jgi:hypothetical protein
MNYRCGDVVEQQRVQLRRRPDLSRYLGDAPERSRWPSGRLPRLRYIASWMVHLAVAHQDESQVLLHPLTSECEVAGESAPGGRIWEPGGGNTSRRR